jgi:hypothetical protein
MPVTLAIPFRDAKRPPPLPMAVEARGSAREQNNEATASTAPPPLPSMRVPKAIVVHDANGDAIDVQAAVLKARRATEELEWQAQAKRVKESLFDSEAAEWQALRAHTAALPVSTPPRPVRPKKPVLELAPPPASSNAEAHAAEEHEWQELRARARLAEEREWQELIARARLSSAPPAHPFDAQLVQRPRPALKPAHVVAWP